MSDITAMQHIAELETELRDCKDENERLRSEIDGLLRMASKWRSVENEVDYLRVTHHEFVAEIERLRLALQAIVALAKGGTGLATPQMLAVIAELALAGGDEGGSDE